MVLGEFFMTSNRVLLDGGVGHVNQSESLMNATSSNHRMWFWQWWQFLLEGIYHGPPKPTFSEAFMVNNLVFRWPKHFLSWFCRLMVYKDQSTFSAAGKCAAENQRSLRFKQVIKLTATASFWHNRYWLSTYFVARQVTGITFMSPDFATMKKFSI